jgi:hypothetical protein
VITTSGVSASGERRPRVLPLPREPTVGTWWTGEGRLLAPRFGGPTRGEYTQVNRGRKVKWSWPSKLGPMRRAAIFAGALTALAGLIFALQGASILPGSYMTGDRLWLVIGAVLVVAGIGLAIWGRRGSGDVG